MTQIASAYARLGSPASGSTEVETPQQVTMLPQPLAMTPQQVTISPQPLAMTPQQVTMLPQPLAMTPQQVTMSPQPLAMTPQQVTMSPQPLATEIKPRDKYKNILYKLGITEVVLGSMSCVLCIATLVIASTVKTYPYFSSYSNETFHYSIRYSFTYASQGIWCGAAIIASGILGIKSRNQPTVCMYNANMAVSIAASCMMGTLCVMSAICAGSVHPMRYARGVIALHAIISIIGFTGIIICIVHSAYCCAGVCCRRKYQGVLMYAPHPAYAQQQMIQLANGQYMMVAQPPMAGFHPTAQQPQPMGVVYPAPIPTQQMTKEQEAQMNPNPPEYSAHSSHHM